MNRMVLISRTHKGNKTYNLLNVGGFSGYLVQLPLCYKGESVAETHSYK